MTLPDQDKNPPKPGMVTGKIEMTLQIEDNDPIRKAFKRSLKKFKNALRKLARD